MAVDTESQRETFLIIKAVAKAVSSVLNLHGRLSWTALYPLFWVTVRFRAPFTGSER